jgi:hypothetical protein
VVVETGVVVLVDEVVDELDVEDATVVDVLVEEDDDVEELVDVVDVLAAVVLVVDVVVLVVVGMDSTIWKPVNRFLGVPSDALPPPTVMVKSGVVSPRNTTWLPVGVADPWSVVAVDSV